MATSRFELPANGLLAAQVCLGQRMPAGDPVRLRSVARQSGAWAADLRHTASTLLAGADTALWSGVAHRAFADQIRAHAPSMSATADRYEHYASALNVYAGALDETAPRLRACRNQLRQRCDELASRGHATAGFEAGGSFGAGSVGTASLEAGSVGAAMLGSHAVLDPAADLLPLARDFKAGYDHWAEALDRCVWALTQADEADPARDAHGYRALLHRVAGVAGACLSPFEKAVLHPSLHNLSDCLGSLSLAMTALGLGLLFLCPPAGAACLAAATVLALAQVAVDTTRRQRGEHVSDATLGLELAAAIPVGGGAFRGLRAADNVVHLVPGGGLMAHEAAGGHTLAKHVGKSETFLRNRLATEPRIEAASTFYSRQVAESTLSTLLDENQARIAAWLLSSKRDLIVSGQAAGAVGSVILEHAAAPQEARGIRLVLRRSSVLTVGFRIHTAMVTM